LKIITSDFRIPSNKPLKIKNWPNEVKPFYKSKSDYEKLLKKNVNKLSDQQQLLYASSNHAILVIFQAMDSAGKDGAIRHVLSGVNPQGCQVFSFKHPTGKELEHNFLWRTTKSLPERGRIGVFNRSYYEEVLIARVHPEIIGAENLPKPAGGSSSIWAGRYRSINEFEQHLFRNGTRIVKIFLHLSKEEQRKRFLARIDTPEKNWKFSVGDIEERKYWDKYMDAYENCISATSSAEAPWYIVPADDKKNARLIISEILLKTLEDLKMAYPKTSAARSEELAAFRKLLANP
jgi:PPK2 family polyphosphate:nucleotide phosphotransferase